MTYEEFLKFVSAKCIHEALYEDTEGRPILVISMLDAYDMVDKAQCTWVGLTEEEIKVVWSQIWYDLNHGKFASDDSPRDVIVTFTRAIEAKLKEKNT
jgi:hypothetical protein